MDEPAVSLDITERLEVAAAEWLVRSALYGMSSAALLREARAEIERLRNELKIEMFNTHIRHLRRTK